MLYSSVTNSTFARNNASQFGFGMGGGVAVEGQHVVDVVACEFQDNYGYIAGALYTKEGSFDVTDSHFCGNAIGDFYGEVILDSLSTFQDSCFCGGCPSALSRRGRDGVESPRRRVLPRICSRWFIICSPFSTHS